MDSPPPVDSPPADSAPWPAGTVALPAAPAAARLARQHARTATSGVEDQAVAVVVSELVTNAVVHVGGPPLLRVRWEGGAVCVEVGDAGAGRPAVREQRRDPVPTGRGLALVEALSEEWGVHAAPGGGPGKVVWARVRPERLGPPPVAASPGRRRGRLQPV